MKVGVIIPVYNARPWIEQMLQTCAWQSYPVSVYLAEDGSTDGSYELLSGRTDLFTKMVVNPEKAGWHGGLNAAARLAFDDGCDAVFTASADDRLDRECIRLCVEEMERDDLDFVIPYCRQFGGADTVQVSLPDVTLDDLVVWPSLTDKALIRREVWEAVGGYSTDVTPPGTWGTAEDWDFWIKCWRAGLNRYAVIPLPLYFVRVHEGQLSDTRGDSHTEFVGLLKGKYPELPWTEDSGVWPPRHRQQTRSTTDD